MEAGGPEVRVKEGRPVCDVAALVCVGDWGEEVVMVISIHEDGDGLLVLAVHAVGLAPSFFGLGQCWEEERCQNCDNSNDNKEFNQGECSSLLQNGLNNVSRVDPELLACPELTLASFESCDAFSRNHNKRN